MNKTISILAIAAFASASSAQIDGNFTDDFEGYDPAAGLIDNGWGVGANVFDSGGNFIYNYFGGPPFPAPNGTGAFSNIGSGEGGPDQGNQQLIAFNDYNNADHGNGSNNLIEANFYREYIVGAGDAGDWTFTFDAKLGDVDLANTSVTAFIKVLDPGAGFATTTFETLDMGTAAGIEWNTFSITATIDASQVGQIFQIGWYNVTSNFNTSGMVYDNVALTPAPGAAAVLGLAGLAGVRRRR